MERAGFTSKRPGPAASEDGGRVSVRGRTARVRGGKLPGQIASASAFRWIRALVDSATTAGPLAP